MQLLSPELRRCVTEADPEIVAELVIHWAQTGLVTLPPPPAALAIERLQAGTHSCHVYRDPADLMEIAVAWLRAGADAGQYCLWILFDAIEPAEAAQALALAIRDYPARAGRGQIELLPSKGWYFDGAGRAKSDEEMGGAWAAKVAQARAAGYSAVRAVGDMSWIAGQPDLERFIAYERRCDELAPQLPLLGLCTYHIDSLRGAALPRVAEAHQRSFLKADGVWHRLDADRAEAGRAAEALRRGERPSCGTRFARPTFGGHPFPPNRHVCGFFRSPEEQYASLIPFITEGFERGEKAVHVVRREAQPEHVRRLKEAGIDAEGALSSGQFELLDWERTYLRGGRFDLNKMPGLIEELISRSRAEGYPLLRYVGNMEWSLEDCPGVEDVLEYESKLHLLLPKYPDPVLCCYDIGKYNAEFLVDMLRVHQTAVICGILNDNPYFVPPERYLDSRSRLPGPRGATLAA